MRTRVALAVLLVVCALAPPSAGAEREPPALRFAEEALTLDPAKLKSAEGIRVEVLNDRAQPLTARFTLTDMGLRRAGASPTAVPTARAIQYDTELRVAPAGNTFLVLKSTETFAKGEYKGQLAVYEESTDSVARIPVTLRVGTPAPVPPKPAVEKIDFDAIRPAPGSSDAEPDPDVLPLSAPGATTAAELGIEKNKALGVLSNGDGETVVVKYEGTVSKRADDIVDAKLLFDGVDHPGEYSGKVDTMPGVDGGEVEMKLLARDSVIWAILVLGAGILIALLMTHWRGSGRLALVLGERASRAADAVRTARKEFVSSAGEKQWARYDTTGDVAEKYAAILEDIQKMEARFFDSTPADEQAKIDTAIEALAKHGEALTACAATLDALEKAVVPVSKLPRVDRALEATRREPQWVSAADELLENGKPISIAEFDALCARATKLLAIGAAWLKWHAQVVTADARIALREDDPHGFEPEDVELVKTARRALKSAWTRLWETDDPDAMTGDLFKALDAALAASAGLPGVRAKRPRALAGEVGAEPGEELVGIFGPVFDDIVRRSEDPAVRATAFASVRKAGDWLQIMVAVALALVTGLEAVYFDKPFGTLGDYFTALAWGLVTAGAVDGVITAIRSYLGGAAPAAATSKE